MKRLLASLMIVPLLLVACSDDEGKDKDQSSNKDQTTQKDKKVDQDKQKTIKRKTAKRRTTKQKIRNLTTTVRHHQTSTKVLMMGKVQLSHNKIKIRRIKDNLQHKISKIMRQMATEMVKIKRLNHLHNHNRNTSPHIKDKM